MGGDFANGAVTGAFGYLFNYCMHGGGCVTQHTSAQGLGFIEGFESYSGSTYLDSGGNPTIGFGHLLTDGEAGLFSGGISLSQGNALLQSDLGAAESAVNQLVVSAPLNQQQFDALVSFTFNAGPGALTSRIAPYLSVGDTFNAAVSFGRYTRSGTTYPSGLTFRRASEANLFLNGGY